MSKLSDWKTDILILEIPFVHDGIGKVDFLE